MRSPVSFSETDPGFAHLSDEDGPFVLRPFKPTRDLPAVQQIWRESGWISTPDQAQLQSHFLAGSLTLVAEWRNQVEGLAAFSPATMMYLDTDLPMAAIVAVNTSRVVRKRGVAASLTARIISAAALQGDAVASLGIFEQGYYDRLGFGAGSYEHWVEIDPHDFPGTPRPRPPVRLSKTDWQDVYTSLTKRRRFHGGVSVLAPGWVRAELGWTTNGFGLGYRDEKTNELTHFVWMADHGEVGPYSVHLLACRNGDQLRELFSLLRTLGDQVRTIRIKEPPGVQLQDFIRKPFRTTSSDPDPRFKGPVHGIAGWQTRILDMKTCMNAIRTRDTFPAFSVHISDPIEPFLPDRAAWKGLSGWYTIKPGNPTSITVGKTAGLPILECSIGAFSRMWLGVRPASGLAVSDDLAAPESLLETLDEMFCIPDPKPDWDF